MNSMTDITELAQLRKELSDPAIGSKDHLRKLSLSLIEELEAKNTEIEWTRKRISELGKVLELKEKQRANWFQMAQKLGEDLDTAEKRNAELERYRTAYMEWSEKTDWVQTDKRFDVLKPWGKHRADVLKAYIELLESRTVKLPPAVSVAGIDVYEAGLVRILLTVAGIKWEAE